LMDDLLEATNRLLKEYTPKRYQGAAVLFRAACEGVPEAMWQGLAEAGITVHEMPGDHLAMMEEPTVVQTAALVAEHLEQGPAKQTGLRRQVGIGV